MTDEEQKLFQHLAQFVSDHKKQFIEKVLSQRTRYVTVVLEDIFQSQNASAVLRTVECLGLQDIHIVEDTAKYHLNVRVLKGANKWLTLHRYRTRGENNIETCYRGLKESGYRILLADPAPDGTPIEAIDVAQGPVALVFGNELRGSSDFAIKHADEKIKIPMFGFTESLNISVSVAICLNTVLPKIKSLEKYTGLSSTEQDNIRLNWYRKVVRRSELLEREFLKTIQ
jgi:tRNA (guanosine-2'-O-)-methyltransferase